MNSNAILPILLELLAKSAVILVAAAILHFALRRASAARRYYVWTGAFAALLFLPLTKLASPLWPLSWQKPVPVQAVAPTSIPDVEPSSIPYSEPASIELATATAKRTNWPGIAIVAWLAGGLFILGYQLVGRIRLAIIERRSTEPNDPHLNALMQAAVDEAAIKGSVALRISEDVPVPVTWGTWRPVLLLPHDWQEWSNVQLVAVLRHELAHITRRDYPARRLSQFAMSLYWPNPLVWLAGAALRRTQEEACDDRVLSYGTPAADYATLLFESVRALAGQQQIADRQALAMARPSSLESRLAAIVDDTRDRRRGGILALLGFIAFIAVTLTFSAIAQVESGSPPAKRAAPSGHLADEKSAESVRSFESVPFTLVPPKLQPSWDRVTMFNSTGETTRSGTGSLVLPQNNPPIPGLSVKGLKRKADSIIIPSLEFRGAALFEGIDFLKKKSIDLDPEKKGINFVLKFPAQDPKLKTPLTLTLKDISFTEAIEYITNLAKVRWRVEDNAIVIADRFDPVIRMKQYELPRGTTLTQTQGLEMTHPDVMALLKRRGVTFPERTSAVYIAHSGRLIVRNTDENLALVDQIVASMTKAASPLVQASTKPKLDAIIIPRLELREVKLTEAIQFLSKRIRELDPEKKGVNIELAWRAEVEQPPITISLMNIPAMEALKYVTNLSSAKFRSESEDRIVVEPLNTVSFNTKQYRVPANAISTKEGIVKGPDGVTYANPHDFFTAFGVTFPPGASAGLPVSGDSIVMRNTEENLELGEEIILALVKAKGGKLPDDQLAELRSTLESLKTLR